MNKKKIVVWMTIAALTLTGCSKVSAQSANCVEGCACTDCVCCEVSQTAETESVAVTDAAAVLGQEAGSTETTVAQEQTESELVQVQTEQQVQEQSVAVSDLTEEDKAARKQTQLELETQLEALYAEANSLNKTLLINQLDKQILANNAYDFSGLNIVFIGDSITEGVAASLDEDGNRLSYPVYVNSYLHFQNVLNHGVAGKMFSEYGGSDLSLDANFESVVNNQSDVMIVFAGVNDYLAGNTDKRFGDVNDEISTAGYCGALRSFMKKMQRYYSDKEIFFVATYNIGATSNGTYTDVTETLTLNDFMEVLRQLAAEYGFHVIDLYQQGFMDCSIQEASDYLLADGIHPNDTGNIVLGEHIAAELSLYFGQNK